MQNIDQVRLHRLATDIALSYARNQNASVQTQSFPVLFRQVYDACCNAPRSVR